MKKVYCLYIESRIVFVSTNLKACHQCLLHHLTEFDKDNLIGYSQITRMMKKYGHYRIDTRFGGSYFIWQYPVYIRFSTELFKDHKLNSKQKAHG